MLKCSILLPPSKLKVRSLKRQHSIPVYAWVRTTSPEREASEDIRTMLSWREMYVSHEVTPSTSPAFTHTSVKASKVLNPTRFGRIHFPAVRTFSFMSLLRRESICRVFDTDIVKPSWTSKRIFDRVRSPPWIVWTEGTCCARYRDLIVREIVSTNW
jgi:hypothetical protein